MAHSSLLKTTTHGRDLREVQRTKFEIKSSTFSMFLSKRIKVICITWNAWFVPADASSIYLMCMWSLGDQLSLSQAQHLEILTQVQPVNKTVKKFIKARKNTTLMYHNLKGEDNMSCQHISGGKAHIFSNNNKCYMPERGM